MARYKRYFPVSHDINVDAEIDELCKRFRVGGLRLWLEILAITDRTENNMKLTSFSLRSLCKRTSLKQSKAHEVFTWLFEKEWIVPKCELVGDFNVTIGTRNYLEFHRMRGLIHDNLHDNLAGENAPTLAEIGVPPTFPTITKKNKSALRAQGKPSLRSVEEAEKTAGQGREQAGESEKCQEPEEGDYLPKGFDLVWDMWPRKEGYPKAKKVWNQLRLPRETIEKILIEVPIWKTYEWKKYSGPQYIKKLENWLAEECYKESPPRRVVC